MRRRICVGLSVFALFAFSLSCMLGCGGPGTAERGGDPSTSRSNGELSSEIPQLDIAVPQEPGVPRAVGVVPFAFSAALPNEIEVPDGEWYCQWETGDGRRHLGTTLEHEYTSPGMYTPSWTILHGEEVWDTGFEEVEVLGILDGRCESGDADLDLTDMGFTAARQLDEASLESAVTLPTRNGFILVSPADLAVIRRIRYEQGVSPAPFVESPSLVFVDLGDEVLGVAKADGATAFRVDFRDLSSQRVRVSAMAYSASRDALFVLVYPSTEDEVNGVLYTVALGTGKVDRLPAPSPIRPYTAGFRTVYNDATDQLLVVTSGLFGASQRLLVVDGITGELVHQLDLRCGGTRGLHLDLERQELWLSGSGVVLRVRLGADGIPVDSAGVQLDCQAIAIDSHTGLCYCLKDVHDRTGPAEIVVLDAELRASLTGAVEAIEALLTDSLHPNALRVVDQPDGRALLIAGSEIYAVSLSTLLLKTSCPAETETWAVGESETGSMIFLDPWSRVVFSLERGSDAIRQLAAPPEAIRSISTELLDATWDAPNRTLFLLFRDRLAKWDTSTSDVAVISLEEYVTSSSRSTLDRVRIVSPSATGSVFIRLPGRAASGDPVYHAYWEEDSVVQVSNEPPRDCSVYYCRDLASLVWVKDGEVVFSESRESITLPQNVRWDEEAGLTILQSTGIAVVLSLQPSGLAAIVDLERGEVIRLLFAGPRRGEAFPLSGNDSVWITADGSVYHLYVAGDSAGLASCFSIPYSIQGSSTGFHDSKRVWVSRDGSTYVLAESDTGNVHVVTARKQQAND